MSVETRIAILHREIGEGVVAQRPSTECDGSFVELEAPFSGCLGEYPTV